MIEATVFDPKTATFGLANVFGVEAASVGLGHEVLIPDLFGDTDKNGTIGDGDVLYSLVDLSAYLKSIPQFSLGESFDVVNGEVAGLAGMMFSTSPFVFDPDTGFSSTPFSGEAIVEGQHGATAVPEPGTLITFLMGMVFLLSYRWRNWDKSIAKWPQGHGVRSYPPGPRGLLVKKCPPNLKSGNWR
jgi:hypothetical protein